MAWPASQCNNTLTLLPVGLPVHKYMNIHRTVVLQGSHHLQHAPPPPPSTQWTLGPAAVLLTVPRIRSSLRKSTTVWPESFRSSCPEEKWDGQRIKSRMISYKGIKKKLKKRFILILSFFYGLKSESLSHTHTHSHELPGRKTFVVFNGTMTLSNIEWLKDSKRTWLV